MHSGQDRAGWPSWATSTLISIVSMALAVGISWGAATQRLDTVNRDVARLQAELDSSARRLDTVNRELDRVTRLEERLTNIQALLSEIKSDIREKRGKL